MSFNRIYWALPINKEWAVSQVVSAVGFPLTRFIA
jgi:hypothetical protein